MNEQLPEHIPFIPRAMGSAEIAHLYGCTQRQVEKMVTDGRLKAIEGVYPLRIYDPLWSLAFNATLLSMDDAYVLRGCEIADFLGISERRVRQLGDSGKLPYRMKPTSKEVRHGNRLYSVTGLRIMLDRYERKRKQTRLGGVRPWVKEWLSRRAKELEITTPPRSPRADNPKKKLPTVIIED